jgi:hypothetical protein
VTSNCVLKLAGPNAGRCTGLAKRLGTKCCPRARRVISAEVSAQLLQALLDLLHCDPPSLVPTDSSSALPAGELRPGIKCGALKLSRDRATQTDTDLLCFAGIETLLREPLSAASCSVVWGFGFRRTGLWARPRPGARCTWWRPRYALTKSGPGLCFLPRNFPGWPWESCLLDGAEPSRSQSQRAEGRKRERARASQSAGHIALCRWRHSHSHCRLRGRGHGSFWGRVRVRVRVRGAGAGA